MERYHPVDVLQAIQRGLAPGETIEVRARHAQTGEMCREWFTSMRAVVDYGKATSPDGYDTWYGINPRRGRTAGDSACTRALALPADIDAKLWSDSLEAALDAIEWFGLPPSVIVASGGGYQPRWLLSQALDLADPEQRERYHTLAVRLARAVCGPDRRPDTIANPERVLRIPGSLNWKYGAPRPVTTLRCTPSLMYTAEEVGAWLDRNAAWTAVPAHPPVPAFVPQVSKDGVIADFNARYNTLGRLLDCGATIEHISGGVVHLIRPGKRHGAGATWNHYPNTLIVFSDNWPPFASWRVSAQQRRGYDPFEVYTLLEHNGNRSAAYRAAMDAGYGEKVILGMDSYTKNAAGTLRAMTRAAL